MANQYTKFGKVRSEAGKPDPRVFSPENPQPDPIHDVDPARLHFDPPPPRQGQRIRHTATEIDKQIEEREAVRNRIIDDGAADEDLMLAPNPMEETVERYRQPGMAYGFMSDHCNAHLGLRGYEVVKDESGQPVKLGKLTLGKIPERVFAARQRKAARESSDNVQELKDQYTQNVDRLKHEGRDLGLRVLEPGEMSGEFTNTETGKRVTIG